MDPMDPVGDALSRLPLAPIPTPSPENSDGLTVTHAGVIVVGGHELRVYQLSDGRRVIDGDDLERFFGVDFKTL